jgi:hypothetical protein
MIMENKDFFEFIEELSKNEDFSNCIASIPQQDIDEQYDRELILRFFCLINNKVDTFVSVDDFIFGNMQLFLQEFNYEANKHFFLSVFQTLNQVL